MYYTFSYFFEINTVKKGSIIRVASASFGSHEQTELVDGIDSDEFGFDWSNGNGNVLFAAATLSWQCNQRLFLYRFCVFPIFPPFRLSVDAFIKSFKLARSLSNDTMCAVSKITMRNESKIKEFYCCKKKESMKNIEQFLEKINY